MDKKSEWKMLFEANAKLNSPEARAVREQLEALQKRCYEDTKPIGPPEVITYLPYVESPEFETQIHNMSETVVEMKNHLRNLQTSVDAERQARIDFEKSVAENSIEQQRIDRIRFWGALIATLVGSIAAVGSLIATIALN